MTAAIGSACLAAALLTALYAAGAALAGARTRRYALVASARRAIWCLAGILTLAIVLIEAAYLRSDLSLRVVAESSSADTPTFYKLTALWATQPGSLLLWAFLLAVYTSAVLLAVGRRLREIVPYAIAVLGGISVFFIALTVFYSSPFEALATPPAEGNGLNPLLRHPAMMIHPPMLYTGYVGFTVPFAFAIGALVTRRTGADWIRATRRFALIAWTALGTGVLMGALWSYSELGWGGYWGWDAVENASLMPWLVGTAFIHSMMVQERRAMLRVWNVSLIIATFVLALVGTFLVRSGIIESIHAFGASTLGKPMLAFIAVVLVGSVALVVSRLPDLRSEGRLDSLLSREAFFLANNLVLIGLCFVIFWGTFFPLISEAVTGTKASVGPPWFARYTTPLALTLALLIGVGPLLSWRRTTPGNLLRQLRLPVLAGAGTLALLVAVTPAAKSTTSLIMFTFVAVIASVAGQELWRGASAQRRISRAPWPLAVVSLVARNRRRYGGYTAHVGIALLFLGVAASSAFHDQRDVRLSPGETTEVGGYEVTYRRPTVDVLDDRFGTGAQLSFGALLEVRRGDERFVLQPARNYYRSADASAGPIGRYFAGESTSEVGVRWGLKRDFWIAVRPDLRRLARPITGVEGLFDAAPPRMQAALLAAVARSYADKPPPASFRAIVSPMVAWIWIGGGVVLLGALTALWPAGDLRLAAVRGAYGARLARDLAATRAPSRG